MFGTSFLKDSPNASAVNATLNYPFGKESAIYFKIFVSAPEPKATE